MCRARHERPPHGRRCPAHSDPERRALAAIRQRIGRYDRAARQAGEAQDWDRQLHYCDLLDRDVAELARRTPPPPAAPVPPTRAAEFTPEASAHLSDDELLDRMAELDPRDVTAQEQIVETLEARERQREIDQAVRDAAAAEEQRRRDEYNRQWAADAVDQEADASPLTNPAARPSRKLTPEQVCRETYDSYVFQAYLDAETACRGNLLSREGLRKGIDPESLFSGPASRASLYASEELRDWWATNGRVTYSEWKYQWFGRESDRKAARTARQMTQEGLAA